MPLAHEVSKIDRGSGIMPANVLTKSERAGAMASLHLPSVGHMFRNVCGQLMSLQPEEVDSLFWMFVCAFALIKRIQWRGVVPSSLSFEGRRS
jgi:hypothetical protein